MRHSRPFFFFVVVVVVLLVVSHDELSSHSLRLEIAAAPIAAASWIDHLHAIARSDELRQGMIAATIAQRRSACESPSPAPALVPAGAAVAQGPESTFAMPLSSGAYTGMGQYFMLFHVGTPAQRFVLIADTGSDLT